MTTHWSGKVYTLNMPGWLANATVKLGTLEKHVLDMESYMADRAQIDPKWAGGNAEYHRDQRTLAEVKLQLQALRELCGNGPFIAKAEFLPGQMGMLPV